MEKSEAIARIRINRLLEAAGWRFFPEGNNPANIRLEPSVKIKTSDLDALGENFEKTGTGFVDFLLLDSKNFPLIVLEAKSENKNPLVGKEQARRYAKSFNCRFVILSNGNRHYFWDLKRGNPYIITTFPTPDSVMGFKKILPDPEKLINEEVGADYIVLTQRPRYRLEAAWKNEDERPEFIRQNNLRFLRPYQLEAIHAVQKSVSEGKDRFLFEMATGTGKTLTAAAVIKLFLKSGNARRVLFLVDRLELEDQAKKALVRLLSKDFQTTIYKENRSDWNMAEIVVATVQSLLFNNKYLSLFSATDFNLVISDEAHRSIGGNSRAVFDYFVGYKLGLTATPRDYLKRFDTKKTSTRDPREQERRLLLDTYRTFGCESGQPTFRYSLLNGVEDKYLINPTVVDARTKITTELLSKRGLTVTFTDDEGEDKKEILKRREFEKRYFSDATNQVFCKTFLENALRDPVSGEIGKSIIFGVSQNHAAKLAQILNVMADKMFPKKYNSDFAVQVTSQIPDAQEFTAKFSNNNLMGSENFVPGYKTSKARVCVTVGMMTTGYDCTDILNLGLFRPIFSPTDFIQIKGRGTRKHNFLELLFNKDIRETVQNPEKSTFKLFDYFANCEYFEEEYNYDQVLNLPQAQSESDGGEEPASTLTYENLGDDILSTIQVAEIGPEGMKIDRMYFENFGSEVKKNDVVMQAIEAEQWDRAIDYVIKEILNKPEEYYTFEKLRKVAGVDRRISPREIIERALGRIQRFKSKDEVLEEEFAKFGADCKLEEVEEIPVVKHYFKAYTSNGEVRDIIERGQFTDLTTNTTFSLKDLRKVPEKYRALVPEYVKDYVPLNQFLTQGTKDAGHRNET